MSKSIHYPYTNEAQPQVQYRYLTYNRLCQSSVAELEKIFARGFTPKVEDLEGWEFRGWNVGFPSRLLGFQKFRKGFLPASSSDDLHPSQRYGYNVIVRQNGLRDPHHALPNEAEPKKHGYYLVTPPSPIGEDNKHLNALLLDYGAGKGDDPFYHPARLLRDYLVQVDNNNNDLFLGKAYFALGPLRVFGGFFVLERYNMIGL